MPRPIRVLLLVLMCLMSLPGCIAHKAFNPTRDEYIRTIPFADAPEKSPDLAIIEFDDHGQFWDPQQFYDTLKLIEKRNAEHPEGVAVICVVHGWKNNADFGKTKGSLADFQGSLVEIRARFEERSDSERPRHLIGVFLSWRGGTTKAPIFDQLSFYDRLDAAERVASLNMQESLFGIMGVANQNPESSCSIYGHSMGGLIVGRTMRPSFTTLVLQDGRRGFPAPADLVVLLNPAIDAYSAERFIDFLKRYRVRTVQRGSRAPREADPNDSDAGGPLIVSITSEADSATGFVYPIGKGLVELGTAFRRDNAEGTPSQSHLVTHTEGHVDHLVSHRADVVDGKVRLEPIEGAWNDTPFWVIRTSGEIIPEHSDFSPAAFDDLITELRSRADLFNTSTQTWVYANPPAVSDIPDGAEVNQQ